MKKKAIVLALGGFILASALFLSLQTERRSDKAAAAKGSEIAVIYVDGVITGSHAADGLWTDGGATGAGALIKRLHRAAADDDVRAIILRINSPGGSSAASEEIGDEIRKIRAQGKTVVASMGDVAASGGYWLAACTDKIYASPSTLTGSIGVYMPYSNWEELYKKIGIRQEKIKSGEHKDILSSDRPMTPEERAILQAIVDETYENFVAAVAEGRHMDPEAVRKLADGRIYTGRQAQAAGLVDELGNLYDAADGTAALVGIAGKPKLREMGRDNPFAALFSLDSKVKLLRALLLHSERQDEAQSAALLAMPEKWED